MHKSRRQHHDACLAEDGRVPSGLRKESVCLVPAAANEDHVLSLLPKGGEAEAYDRSVPNVASYVII